MAFFVRVQKGQSRSNDTSRYDVTLILLAKKLGFDFTEINELRVQDLVDMAELETKEEGPREATQDDIDKFFG